MGATFMATCNNGGTTGEKTGQAAQRDTSENLLLQVLTSQCTASSVQDSFRVTNNDVAPIRLSDITVKLWVNETTANAIQASTSNGCVAEAGQGDNCNHSVGATKVNVAATPQACAGEQANWVVSITTNDHSSLNPGESWTNFATQLTLPHNRAFTPGPAGWYSGCGGSSYAPSTHAALYYQGSLVRASAGIPPACMAPTGSQNVGGAAAPGIVAGTYPLVGPLPPSTPMKLVISLPRTQQPGNPPLSDRIDQMYDPTNALYHQYMSATTFAAAYGPLQSDYDALTAFASANGLTVVDTYTSRAALGVTGTAAAVENALNVTLNQYKRPDGTVFYAPANDPSVNLTVPLLFIAGLDNLAVPHANNGGDTSYTDTTCIPDFSPHPPGETTGSDYVGGDFRKAYVPGAGQGSGQVVGLLEFDTYYPTDIVDYDSSYVHSPFNLYNCDVTQAAPCGATVTAPPAPGGGGLEVTLNIDMVHSMAPAAQVRVYYQSAVPNSGTFVTLMQRAADEPFPYTPSVISNSWTWEGTSAFPNPAIAQTLQQIAAQGQSFFQASGDYGSYISTGIDGGVGSPGGINVPEPIIDSSLMTVVGGTQLATGPAAAYIDEKTWNNPNRSAGGLGAASGGGFCNTYTAEGAGTFYATLPIPSYQLNPGPFPANTEVSTLNTLNARMIPDVSIVADQFGIYLFNGTHQPMCAGGTSASVALWAGIAALLNEASPGGFPVGFANPTLYRLASTVSSYGNNFHDVGSGALNTYANDNNQYNPTGLSNFHASAGYDLATGLGSPKAGLLTGALPPQSCQSGGSLSMLIDTVNQNVTAYVPNGSWDETTGPAQGVRMVPLELGNGGTVPPASDVTNGGVAIADAINTCSGNSATGQVVCTGNTNNIYLISGSTVQTVQHSASAIASENFSGGNCVTCNVAIDQTRNFAYVSMGIGPGAGIQSLDLTAAFPTAISGATNASPTVITVGSTSTIGSSVLIAGVGGNTGANGTWTPRVLSSTTFSIPVDTTAGSPYSGGGTVTGPNPWGTVIPVNTDSTSESIVVDSVRNLILSPNEDNNYQLVNPTNGQVFDNQLSAGGEFDSAAEDCSTGIALASVEFTNQLFLIDLTQATFTAGVGPANGTWSSPASNLTGYAAFSGLSAGTSGLAVNSNVPGGAKHLGATAGEFGGSAFGIFQLPSSAGVGAPPLAMVDWVGANIPPSPDGHAWSMGDDPHTLTVYVSPNNQRQYAVFQDDWQHNGTRTWLAVVDMDGVLTSPLRSGNTIVGTLPSCTGPGFSAGCLVSFVAN